MRVSAPHYKKGEMGSVKGETKSANFWKGKVFTHSQVRIFGNGKCKLIAKLAERLERLDGRFVC